MRNMAFLIINFDKNFTKIHHPMQKPVTLSLFYLPPVSYFSCLKTQNFQFLLERCEHFPKQTYRNRTCVQSPNGVLVLTVPVVKGSKTQTPIKDVKISYDFNWQRLHWLSLQNNYRSSAYFEFYEDGLAPFYQKKINFLFDFNLELFQWINKQLKLDIELKLTESYVKELDKTLDFRNTITKQNALDIKTKPYFQVFGDRCGFINNLSVVDLLFSQGPQAENFF